MPELPEVETSRRYFDTTSLHKEIDDVQVKVPRILSRITADDLKKVLVGDQFQSSMRVGKYLFSKLRTPGWYSTLE